MAWEISTTIDIFEIAAAGYYPLDVYKVDTNHFIMQYRGADNDGYAQVLEVNTSTWAISTASSEFEFYSSDIQLYGIAQRIVSVDTNHFLYAWRGQFTDAYVQVLEVNTSTWAVSASGSRKTYDSGEYGGTPHVENISGTNKFIIFYQGNVAPGAAMTLEVNTSTWAVTTKSSRFTFDSISGWVNNGMALDTNHFLNCWRGDGYDGYAQVFTVNTSTWAITTTVAAFEFDEEKADNQNGCAMDDNHYLVVYLGSGNDGYATMLEINTSTWAITTTGVVEFEPTNCQNPTVTKIDDSHAVVLWQDSSNNPTSIVIEVNTSTWAISTSSDEFKPSTGIASFTHVIDVDSSHLLGVWRGNGTFESIVMEVEEGASGPANLKSYNGVLKANIKSINGLAIASIKSINGLE